MAADLTKLRELLKEYREGFWRECSSFEVGRCKAMGDFVYELERILDEIEKEANDDR